MHPEMAYNERMPPVSSYNEEMDDYGRYEYDDVPPDFIDNRSYGSQSRERMGRVDFDYNHGLNRPSKLGRDLVPYGYESRYRGEGESDPDALYGSNGFDRYRGRHRLEPPIDQDIYYGRSGANIILGPDGPETNHRHSSDMRQLPPGPNGPHDIRKGPHGTGMYHGSHGQDIRNGPHGPDLLNGLHGPSMYPGRHGRDIHDTPYDADVHNRPHGPNTYQGPYRQDVGSGTHGPNMYHSPHDHDMHDSLPSNRFVPLVSDHHQRPHGPHRHYRPPDSIYHGPLGPNAHPVPPGPDVLLRGPLLGVPPPDVHIGAPPPDLHLGVSPLDIHLGAPPTEVHLGAPPPGPDLRMRLPPPSADHPLGTLHGPIMHRGPPHHGSPFGSENPHIPHHNSPLYPNIPCNSQPPVIVPPPPLPFLTALPASTKKPERYPPEESPTNPPLPPSPPRECRPPTPPSPYPSPPPRPPSPSSPCPQSPLCEMYNSSEARFSSSNSTSPEVNEKQRDSSIKKYVKSVQKLKSSDKTDHAIVESIKSRKKIGEKMDCNNEPQMPKESPTRPNLDTRLRLMFGALSKKESPEKRKLPPKPLPPLQMKKEEIRDIDKPLSPPPSPYKSRHLYHFWHKVTVKLRKTYTVSSVDFVSASLKVKRQAEKLNSVKIPTKPAASLPLPNKLPSTSSILNDNNEILTLKVNSLKADSNIKGIHRMHPYKTSDSKDRIIKSSLDSEFEITCDITPEEGKGEKEITNNANTKLCDRESPSVSVECNQTENGEEPSDVDKRENLKGDEGKANEKVNDKSGEEENAGSNIGSKTISIVLSKILQELRTEIQREIYGNVVDEEIQKYIEKHTAS